MKHPPGKKMYQRGAHTIWEVDGAKEKVFPPFVLFVVANTDLLLALLPEFITFWKIIYRC